MFNSEAVRLILQIIEMSPEFEFPLFLFCFIAQLAFVCPLCIIYLLKIHKLIIVADVEATIRLFMALFFIFYLLAIISIIVVFFVL
jgi:hypothetical protein